MTRRELTPSDYIAMVRRRWVLITALTVIGPPLAYGVSRILPAEYKSQTLVLVQPPTVSSKIVQPIDTIDLSQRLASMQQQILSRTRLEPIIHQFKLYSKDADRASMDDLVARLQKAIEVTPIEPMAETQANNLPGFFVNVTLGDPHTAQGVCNAVTSMFIEENLRLSQKHSEATTEFLTQQLTEAKQTLDDQDAKLAAFKGRNMGSLPDDEKANLGLLTGLTTQLDATTQALARAQQDKSFAQSMLAQQLAALQETQSGQNPETLGQQLVGLQSQLTDLQARYTDDYPDVIKVKSDIALLKKKIADNNAQKSAEDSNQVQTSMEPVQITQLRTQIHSYDLIIAEKTREQEKIKQQIALYQERIQSSPTVEQQYKELTRGYQTALDSYNELLKNQATAAMATELQRDQEGEQFRVLDPANFPDKPSFPNRLLFAGGGLAGGLAMGLGLAFLLEMRDTSIRTERDIEFALGLPVLVTIPVIEPASAKGARAISGQQQSGSKLELGARG